MAKRQRPKFSREATRKAMRVFKYIKPFRVPFIFGFIILVLSTVAMLAFPRILGNLMDAVKSTSDKEVTYFIQLLIGLFFVIGVSAFLRIYLFGIVAHKSLALLKTETYKHLISSPMSFFSQKRVGELSSRISNDISLLQETFTITIAELIRQIITIPVGLFFLIYISGRLTVFIIAVIPVIAIIGIFFGKFIKKLSVEAQDDITESTKVVDETLHGIASVKAYANEFFELMRYNKSINQSVNTSIKRAKWRGAFIGLIMFVAGSALMAIVWYGLYMVAENEADASKGITIGELLQFALYAAFIGVSFGGTADLFSQLQKAIGATESLMDILEEKTENISLEKPKAIEIEGNVTFENVNFSYPSRRDIEVLRNISFKVEKGKQIAFVGPSGAGKSTIASLIFGFYNPTGGAIKIDDKNLSDYHLSEIRSQMALVPQEVLLFGGTIKENIEYGKPGATDEEIF